MKYFTDYFPAADLKKKWENRRDVGRSTVRVMSGMTAGSGGGVLGRCPMLWRYAPGRLHSVTWCDVSDGSGDRRPVSSGRRPVSSGRRAVSPPAELTGKWSANYIRRRPVCVMNELPMPAGDLPHSSRDPGPWRIPELSAWHEASWWIWNWTGQAHIARLGRCDGLPRRCWGISPSRETRRPGVQE